MRITLFLLAFTCCQLNAQDKTKAALTAGSEFLDKNQQQPTSITSQQSDFLITTNFPHNEQISSVKNETAANSSQNGTHPGLYIIVFLLAGIAIFFFTDKNKTSFNSQISLEEEEEQWRKKELWDAMAEPEAGE